jgi:hypothetical protein
MRNGGKLSRNLVNVDTVPGFLVLSGWDKGKGELSLLDDTFERLQKLSREMA